MRRTDQLPCSRTAGGRVVEHELVEEDDGDIDRSWIQIRAHQKVLNLLHDNALHRGVFVQDREELVRHFRCRLPLRVAELINKRSEKPTLL